MEGRFLLSFLGILLLLVGCSENSDNTASQPEASQSPSIATDQPTFGSPLVSQSQQVRYTPPVPGLLQPTNAKTRTNAIVTGRSDPFAAIPSSVTTVVVAANRSPSKVNITPLPSGSSSTANKLPTIPLPPLATGPVAPLPNLSNSPLPPIGIPAAPLPPPSPTALAESIQVNGVVQVAGKWNVIVKEASASSSRYVAVGEYLENGRVLVKKVVSPNSTEPIVVLQQDGVEIRKSLV